MDDVALSEIHNYRRLSPQLHTAGQPTAQQLGAVARAGCTTVINLGLHGADYSLPDERSTVEALGMAYVHIPVQWEHPTRQDLDRFSQTLAAREGQQLFVHCAANVRVSVFVALHRVLHQGWSEDEAFDVVDRSSLPAVWCQFIAECLSASPFLPEREV